MLLRTTTLVLVVVTVIAASTRASAQDAESDALIDQGVTLREQGRDAEARDLFERAYQRSRSARALAQLGLAEQALGEWVKAYTHVTAALAAGGAWIDERREPLEESLERITDHIGQLEVVGGVPGAEVRVNGELAGTLPLPESIPVLAGTVVLEVTAPGYVPTRRTIEVRARGRAREQVPLVASGSAQAPTEGGGAQPTRAPTGPDRGLIGGAIGGYAIAGVGLIVMAVFGGLTAAEHGDLAEGCGATRTCTSTDVADANTFALVSDVGLGVAVAGAVVGTILLAVGLSTDSSGEEATLTPWATPDGVGAIVRARF